MEVHEVPEGLHELDERGARAGHGGAAGLIKQASGDAELSCSVPCALSFFLKQGTLREQYAKAAWRALAMETLKIDYHLDLAYYYLGMAAAALGFKDAGRKYLNLAIAASASKESSCADGILVRCGELDIRTAAQSALAQM